MTKDQDAFNFLSGKDWADSCHRAGARLAAIDRRVMKLNGVPIGLNRDDDGNVAPVVLEDVIEADLAAQTRPPPRRKGTAQLLDERSFVDHVNRFKNEHSAVFAVPTEGELTAVLDYHPPGGTAHCEHRSEYQCPFSLAWKFWTLASERTFSQDSFGDLIESRLEDLTLAAEEDEEAKFYAKPLDLLSLARELRVNLRATYQRKYDRTTGEQALVAKEEHGDRSSKIPRRFVLLIPVFDGGELYRVRCDLVMRMHEGRPKFGFSIHRQQDLVRDAFDKVCARVKQHTKLPLFLGMPE